MDRCGNGGQLAVAHLTGSISRLAGGPYESVRRAAQELARLGCRVTVAAPADRRSGEDAASWDPVKPVVLEAVQPRSFGYSTGWRRFLEAEAPDVVHVQGLWMAQGPVAFAWRRRTGRPYVVSPRGMLEPWALKYRGWKKSLALWAWERRVLDGAACLHATSEEEAAQFRVLGLKTPIAVIPNGVDVPPEGIADRDAAGDRVAAFLSRVHPKKGLPMLLHAWATVRPARWRLVIAGPDECGHEAELRRMASELGLESQLEFRGPVYGEAKWDFLRGADLFVLPTYSENFGIAVAEALASALPVITTKGAPWGSLETRRCGWWVDIGVPPLAWALSEATQCYDSELRQMGLRGRQFVSREYSWARIAAEFAAVYQWSLSGGPKPHCIAN
jgi:glycosyltransferase involved in cell wall biosynthesis